MRQRVVVALVVGLAVGVANALWLTIWAAAAWDFTWPLRGAQVLARGADPYAAPLPDLPYEPSALYYPLPAVLAALPFSACPDWLAGTLFSALSAAVFAYGLTQDQQWWRLSLLLSPAFVMAVRTVQWSPLLSAAAFLPALTPLWIAKPNIGLPLLIFKPGQRAVLGMLCFGLLSFVVLPTWPFGWLRHVAANIHVAPISTGVGPVLLLALLRWRTPEARLLIGMALVPQRLLFYDQLPLWLGVRSLHQSLVLSIAGWVGMLGWTIWTGYPPLNISPTWAVWILYMPALVLVLWPSQQHAAGVRSWFGQHVSSRANG